jgi:hypothetical protein
MGEYLDKYDYLSKFTVERIKKKFVFGKVFGNIYGMT